MNVNLPTATEFLKFQIEHYSELMKNPRSFKHKIFLRKEIYNLKKKQDERPAYDTADIFFHSQCDISRSNHKNEKRLEKMYGAGWWN